ncbi:MAG: DNA methylase N-4 [Sphingomonadaceae bacterium]|nr:DNA methylase N-4 [Sphingomonadaceae bacterium]
MIDVLLPGDTIATVPPAYQDFLEAKRPPAPVLGWPCDLDEVPTHLTDGREVKPHQRAIIAWAVRGGRRALFEKFGLGKSIQQLLIADIILNKINRKPIARLAARGVEPARALIVAPLGVRREFRRDARLAGVGLTIIRETAEIAGGGIYLTHYEAVREGKIDVDRFDVVSLDEASVLRSFGSKTYQTFLPLFEGVSYRFVATATPSPNRFKELIHYAGFLGIMDTGHALTRFFQRNSEKANDLTLYPHKEAEFWAWLNDWAVFLQTPSDLGFSDDGYALPELVTRWHAVQVDLRAEAGSDDRGQGLLLRDAALGVTQAAREKRLSLTERVAKAAEIVAASPDDHFVIWHDIEAEREALERVLPGIVTISGATDLDTREERIAAFADGHTRLIGLKPVMFGSGTNIQRHCHRAIYVGVGFKFNDLIQSVHRLQRFGQQRPVEIDFIHAETETEVVRELKAKWARHDELTATMSALIRERGLGSLDAPAIHRTMGVERREASGKGWRVVHNDCVDEVGRMPAASVDLVVTSIPFGNQYEYTPSFHDFGHSDDSAHFFAQMDFLTPSLMRVVKPGRLACVHVKDRIQFGAVTGEGVPTIEPFSDLTVAHFRAHGWQFMSRITVTTDVVRENNQTYRLSYSEMLKDGTKMGAGMPEYVLVFRRPQTDRSRGYADTPVSHVTGVTLRDGRRFDEHDIDFEDALAGDFGPVDKLTSETYSLARWQVDAHAFWRSSGRTLLTADELAQLPTGQLPKAFAAATCSSIYDFGEHIRLGEAVAARDGNDPRGSLPKTFMALAPASICDDVWTDVTRMRTLNGEQSLGGREKHVCPLQIDIVDRLIERYSMPGEEVFDPFAGIGTVPVRALKLGRRGSGSELNGDYWRDAVRYCQAAEAELEIPDLFDLLGVAA